MKTLFFAKSFIHGMCLLRAVAIVSLGTMLPLMASAELAKPSLMMDDPLFGIKYNPSEIHFDDAPLSVKENCQMTEMVTLWVYAKWKENDVEYFIVSGFIEVGPDSGTNANDAQALESDLSGAVVALRQEKCEQGTPEFAMRGEVVRTKKFTSVFVPREVREMLAVDAISRYSKAFGGRDNFLKAIGFPHIEKLNLPPVINEQVRKFAGLKYQKEEQEGAASK